MKPRLKKTLDDIKPYEPGKPEEAVRRELGIERIIKLASNESPYPPFPEVLDVISRTAKTINRYPDGDYFELKSSLSKHLGVDESRIALGNGSSEIIRALFTATVDTGDTVIFGSPSFVLYSIYSQIFGARAKTVPLKEYRHDLTEMIGAIDDRTRLIIVCNPNNPTGAYNNAEEIIEFVESVPEEIVILFDEAYYEYVTADDFPSSIFDFYEKPNVIVTRTFSKIYSLAGLRIGYAVCPSQIAEALMKVREPFSVDRIANDAALEALKHQERVQERKDLNSKELARLSDGLSRMGFTPIHSEANFLLIKTRCSGREVFDKLQRTGVIVRPGEPLGIPNHIRVTVGTPEENDIFLTEMERIVQGLGVRG